MEATLKLGVESLVILSVSLTPESLADLRSGAAGAVGAIVSTITVKAAPGAEKFPAASTERRMNVRGPSATVLAVYDEPL